MLDPTELFPEVPNLYEFPSVHAGMLYDKERVSKYSEAISQVVKKPFGHPVKFQGNARIGKRTFQHKFKKSFRS